MKRKATTHRLKRVKKLICQTTSWFGKIATMMFYLNDPTQAFKSFLENSLWGELENVTNFYKMFFTPEKDEEEFSFGDVAMGMIACQEMSMGRDEISMTLLLDENKKLYYSKNNSDRKERCVPLGLDKHQYMFYQAIQYPIKVPVSYFLGALDGATSIDQGMAHFKNVGVAQKQALVMKTGGHLPSLGLLENNRSCNEQEEDCSSLAQNKIQTQIFQSALMGQVITTNLLLQFNKSGELQWKKI